jgi:hypothetical protein
MEKGGTLSTVLIYGSVGLTKTKRGKNQRGKIQPSPPGCSGVRKRRPQGPHYLKTHIVCSGTKNIISKAISLLRNKQGYPIEHPSYFLFFESSNTLSCKLTKTRLTPSSINVCMIVLITLF